VHRARVGEQLDDGLEDLLEVERRADRGDDLVEDATLVRVRRVRGNRGMVERGAQFS
jgi:hypothetical protein